jgi:uncharacterized protein DUF6930
MGEKQDFPEDSAKKRKGGDARRFFEEQLSGEEALTFVTAKRLFDLAEETIIVKPWRGFADTELVVVKDPELGGLCFCSVLGQLGEVFAIHVYRGMESYRLFKKIASGATIDAGEFFGSQHSLTLEFLTPRKLSPLDRELALALGHPLKKGTMAPQFRAGRPGYRPWYPTENEGKVLALCVESVLAFCEHVALNPDTEYWKHEDIYPQVIWSKKKYFRVENTLVRVTPAPPPDPVPLDEERLQKLSRLDLPLRGVIEVDEFHNGAPVGERNQRKACLRVAMAVDAQNLFLYTVEALEPFRSGGEVLMEAVLQTIERHHFVPAEVLVRDEHRKLLLAPLKERFGFELCVKERLSALEFAKRDLQKALGDPGPL